MTRGGALTELEALPWGLGIVHLCLARCVGSLLPGWRETTSFIGKVCLFIVLTEDDPSFVVPDKCL